MTPAQATRISVKGWHSLSLQAVLFVCTCLPMAAVANHVTIEGHMENPMLKGPPENHCSCMGGQEMEKGKGACTQDRWSNRTLVYSDGPWSNGDGPYDTLGFSNHEQQYDNGYFGNVLRKGEPDLMPGSNNSCTFVSKWITRGSHANVRYGDDNDPHQTLAGFTPETFALDYPCQTIKSVENALEQCIEYKSFESVLNHRCEIGYDNQNALNKDDANTSNTGDDRTTGPYGAVYGHAPLLNGDIGGRTDVCSQCYRGHKKICAWSELDQTQWCECVPLEGQCSSGKALPSGHPSIIEHAVGYSDCGKSGSNMCESCEAGYRLTSNDNPDRGEDEFDPYYGRGNETYSCKKNQCICTGGQPVVRGFGSEKLVKDAIKDEYYVEDRFCFADGAESCKSCDSPGLMKERRYVRDWENATMLGVQTKLGLGLGLPPHALELYDLAHHVCVPYECSCSDGIAIPSSLEEPDGGCTATKNRRKVQIPTGFLSSGQYTYVNSKLILFSKMSHMSGSLNDYSYEGGNTKDVRISSVSRCQSCNSGFALYQGKIGRPSSDPSEVGFYPDDLSNHIFCAQTSCDCRNGNATVGQECPKHSHTLRDLENNVIAHADHCDACNPGFFKKPVSVQFSNTKDELIGNGYPACEPNVCRCRDGTPHEYLDVGDVATSKSGGTGWNGQTKQNPTNTCTENGASECASCDPGFTFDASGGEYQCKPTNCAAGMYTSISGSFTAVATFSDVASTKPTCTDCDDGTFRDVGATSYKEEKKAIVCIAHTNCAAGQYTSGVGTTTAEPTCTGCKSGFFKAAKSSDSLATDECTAHSLCPAGEYTSAVGTATADTTCVECNSGTFRANGANSLTDIETSAVCIAHTNCLEGSFTETIGTTTAEPICTPCTSGSFKATDASTSMSLDTCNAHINCLAGTYTSAVGTTTEQTTCTDCSAGSWRPTGPTSSDAVEAETDVCLAHTNCPAGKYTSTVGTTTTDTECADCSAGFWRETGPTSSDAVEAETDVCVAHTNCLAGTYTSAAGTTTDEPTCADCSAGFWRETGATSSDAVEAETDVCVAHINCLAGEYTSAAGTTTEQPTCLTCGDGFFKAADASTSMSTDACNAHTNCLAGTYTSAVGTTTEQPTCTDCSAGSWRETAPTSSDAVEAETDVCVAHINCLAGEYTSAVGTTTKQPTCLTCGDGFFKAADASTSLSTDTCNAHTNCLAGKYTSEIGTTTAEPTCLVCKDGFFKATGSTTSLETDVCLAHIQECGSGKEQDTAATNTNDRTCKDCTAGTTFSDDNGACKVVATCGAGTGVKVSPDGYPTKDTDTTCQDCNAGDDKTWNKEDDLTYCAAHTPCPKGKGNDENGDHTKDTKCVLCIAGSTYSDSSSTAEVCKEVKHCSAGEQEDQAPTTLSDRTCKACDDGTYAAAGANTCTAHTSCGKQLNQDTRLSGASSTAAGSCEACSAGSFADSVTANCESWTNVNAASCGAGSFWTIGSTTADSSCVACSPEKFSANNNAVCASWTNANAASCADGSFWTTGSTTADSSCVACAGGQFSASNNAVCNAHTNCPAGKYTSTVGTTTTDTECADCSAGFWRETGATSSDAVEAETDVCVAHTNCLAGTYTSAAGTTTDEPTCADCSAGSWRETGATSSDAVEAETDVCVAHINCPAGEYTSAVGTTTEQPMCLTCGDGFFKAAESSASMSTDTCNAHTNCPAGKYTSTVGTTTTDTECADCSAGFWRETGATSSDAVEAETDVCVAHTNCLAGTYTSAAGTTTDEPTCADCSAGSWRETGATSSDAVEAETDVCVAHINCPAGEYTSAVGTTTEQPTCLTCGDGFFKAAESSASMSTDTCNAHTNCLAGKYTSEIGTTTAEPTCLVCKDGFFKATGSTTSLETDVCLAHTNCLAGTYTSEIGTTTDEPTCSACEDGSFTATDASTSMAINTCKAHTNCLAGTYTSEIGSTTKEPTCTKCERGYFKSTISTSSLATDTCSINKCICTHGVQPVADGVACITNNAEQCAINIKDTVMAEYGDATLVDNAVVRLYYGGKTIVQSSVASSNNERLRRTTKTGYIIKAGDYIKLTKELIEREVEWLNKRNNTDDGMRVTILDSGKVIVTEYSTIIKVRTTVDTTPIVQTLTIAAGLKFRYEAADTTITIVAGCDAGYGGSSVDSAVDSGVSSCSANQCNCKDGVADALGGPSCFVDGMEACTSCNVGYYLDPRDNTCVEEQLFCSSQTKAATRWDTKKGCCRESDGAKSINHEKSSTTLKLPAGTATAESAVLNEDVLADNVCTNIPKKRKCVKAGCAWSNKEGKQKFKSCHNKNKPKADPAAAAALQQATESPTEACKKLCMDDKFCTAAEVHPLKGNGVKMYKCELHTSLRINSASRSSKSCRKATCSIKF